MHSPIHLTAAALAFAAAPAAAQISFGGPTNYGVGTEPAGVATGDFDGDGDADIAVSTDVPDKVEILLNAGDGSFAASGSILVGGGAGADALVARDFDCDGDTDIAVILHNSNAVRLLTNNAGTFTAGATTGVGGLDPRKMAAADLDGDGDVDLVTANQDSDDVSVLLNAAGTLSAGGTFGAGQDLRGIALANVVGNGLPDILVAAHDDRSVDVLQNMGGGNFSFWGSLSVGAQRRPSGVTAADFDGDGDVDVAASSSGNAFNSVSVFANTGGGFSAATHFPVTGINPDTIVAADLDLDGDLDLATANQDSNDVTTLENLGGLSFSAVGTFATGTNPEAMVAVDLDGRASSDLVAANRDSHNVSVLLNQAGEPGLGSRFCPAVCNSSGLSGLMSVTGSTLVGADNLILTATQLPPGPNIGYFIMGTGTNTFTPPGSAGPICVAPGIKRYLAPVNNTRQLAGGFSRTVGTAGPISGNITVDSTWSFQAWHRDGMQPSNLTDAVSVTFQ